MEKLNLRCGTADSIRPPRRSLLLLGTALATSLIGVTLMSAPAAAQATCPGGNAPIALNENQPIDCDNANDRANPAGDAILLETTVDGSYITVDNSGDLTAINNAGDASGIDAETDDDDSAIVIDNTGQITANASLDGYGIDADTNGDGSPIVVTNSGGIAVIAGNNGFGIYTDAIGDNDSPITVTNSGDIVVTAGQDGYGIYAAVSGNNSPIVMTNSGDIDVEAGRDGFGLYAVSRVDDNGAVTVFNEGQIGVVAAEVAAGIYVRAFAENGSVDITNRSGIRVTSTDENAYGFFVRTFDGASVFIDNSGDVAVAADIDGYGIMADLTGADGSLLIENSGAFTVVSGGNGYGIRAETSDDDSPISIVNSGGIAVNAGEDGFGIRATSFGANSAVTVDNSGDIAVEAGERGLGIRVSSYDSNSAVTVNNSGELTIDAGEGGIGIRASLYGANSAIIIGNSGDMTVNAGEDGYGIRASSYAANNVFTIVNSGNFTVNAAEDGFGILATTSRANNPVSISNSGDLTVGAGDDAFGINVGSSASISIVNSGNITATAVDQAVGIRASSNSAIDISNSGDIAAAGGYSALGIFATSNGAVSITNSGDIAAAAVNSAGIFGYSDILTTITNLAGGSISASNGRAINIDGGAGQIFNAGLITGFVDLTGNADYFENQSGGVFQAQGVSDFGGGSDLFRNKDGGVVDTADDADTDEVVSFVNLERFENFGTISLVDGAPGDLFTIANVVGASNLEYEAGSNLNVDAFLGAAGSRSDIFRIDGNVSGVTDVAVFNTNNGPGVFNPDGIRVVEVTGAVDDSAFRLANGPIDTGFFNFDLFAEQDGTQTNFELRSFVGGGAFILPQLVTATQDIWHQTSDTWFNRSADLRTALRGGAVPGVPGAMYLGGSAKDGPVAQGGLAPAVWAKASAGSLERDDSANTSAFGRSFQFDLNRELHVADFQTGIDFGKRGVLNAGDALLFSVFGGGVFSNLQYDRLDRRFDMDGGQVGVAATYLSGGLFVDALFNAQFLDVEADNFAFPQKFDADTYGFRLDTGYRFQRSRFFFEPLLTLSVAESDLDGFSVGGNTVSFEEETSVRGRVGLRAGTTTTILGVHAEPYVIASYWSELGDGDTQRATLVSSGTSFALTDAAEESWTEISFGSNYFLFGSNAVSAFTKTDIVFGHDIDGYQFTGGFRVQW